MNRQNLGKISHTNERGISVPVLHVPVIAVRVVAAPVAASFLGLVARAAGACGPPAAHLPPAHLVVDDGGVISPHAGVALTKPAQNKNSKTKP